MSLPNYLTEKVTGMAKDKVDEFLEKIKEKVEYGKLVKSIEDTIEKECEKWDNADINDYSGRIKQIFQKVHFIFILRINMLWRRL